MNLVSKVLTSLLAVAIISGSVAQATEVQPPQAGEKVNVEKKTTDYQALKLLSLTARLLFWKTVFVMERECDAKGVSRWEADRQCNMIDNAQDFFRDYGIFTTIYVLYSALDKVKDGGLYLYDKVTPDRWYRLAARSGLSVAAGSAAMWFVYTFVQARNMPQAKKNAILADIQAKRNALLYNNPEASEKAKEVAPEVFEAEKAIDQR